MKKIITRNVLQVVAASCFLLSSTPLLFAQVKIGSNPTVISTDANLEVEATDATPFKIQKSNGYVGINTLTPINLAHVSATTDNQNLVVDLKNGTSSVQLLSDGGINVKRVGSSKALASHVGGYVDLIGQTGGSQGWRIAQYATYLGISNQPESNVGIFPLYVHNDYTVSIGTSGRIPTAKLQVAGQICAVGYATRAGNSGATTGNNFNISWSGTSANLWIDNTNFGVISLTSDYRLKKNVAAMNGHAVDRVKMLRPVSFEYKAIGGDLYSSDQKVVHEGFIAHELQKIVPSAVNGQKDALTKDGKIQPQTLNPFPVISLLTKAVQEQQAQIEKLQAENLALRAQNEKVQSMSTRLAEIEAKLQVVSISERRSSNIVQRTK